MNDAPLWTPGPDRVADTRMDSVRRQIADAIGGGLPDSRALHQFSVECPGDFWDVVWGECGVIGDRGDGSAYVPPPAGADLRGARFFPASRLNYAENLLAGGQLPGAGPEAIVFVREDGVRRCLSWAQLADQVATVRHWLAGHGVGAGDRVAAVMPNVPETVVAMLAAASLGAIFTSTSPDFGAAGILDRFGQVEPKVLLACDGYVYGLRHHDRLARVADVAAALPSLRAVLVHGELAQRPDLAGIEGRVNVPVASWADVVSGSSGSGPGAELTFEQLGFDHPLYVLYSSGTTGVPKCIVHRAGGILLKHLVEHRLHCDIRPGDRVCYFTTCGWMMWNWLVSVLASGATAVLYDGSPLHPGPEALWDLVESERVTLFGTSAKFIDASAKAGARPGQTHDFTSLRTICSTGSPLSAQGFEYIYREVKPDLHLASISGGTDLCGCFVMGDPTRPVYAGEIQGPALGMAVDIADEEGKSLADRPGERGELVCTQAFPSMPVRFWGDPEGEKYTAAYFGQFPGIWAHGDFASWTVHGGVVIHGRSDATLNAAGVRIGTAEIYREVEQLPQVAEALAIGQEWDGDTRIVLFVRMRPGSELDDELRRTINARLREQCSPRHVPARIVAVTDLPRTRSGKLAELAVADVVHGREVRNIAALANPRTLTLFADVADLNT